MGESNNEVTSAVDGWDARALMADTVMPATRAATRAFYEAVLAYSRNDLEAAAIALMHTEPPMAAVIGVAHYARILTRLFPTQAVEDALTVRIGELS